MDLYGVRTDDLAVELLGQRYRDARLADGGGTCDDHDAALLRSLQPLGRPVHVIVQPSGEFQAPHVPVRLPRRRRQLPASCVDDLQQRQPRLPPLALHCGHR